MTAAAPVDPKTATGRNRAAPPPVPSPKAPEVKAAPVQAAPAQAAPAQAAPEPEPPIEAPAAIEATPVEEPKAPASIPPPSNRKRASSLRPPPPSSKRESIPPPSLVFEGFDEGSIAYAFDALMSDEPSSPSGESTFDLTPVRELFAELAANHMRHVRDFMIDVKFGEATRDWVEICIPAVKSLTRAAERLELVELATGLEGFGQALANVPIAEARTLSTTTKEGLLDAYGKLVEAVPTAFALDRDKSQREAVIVQSLLLSVPDVRKVTIDKLYAAGLTSLKVLFDAKADEIAAVADIPDTLAMRIVERFQEYRAELVNVNPGDARAAERERLATLTNQLKVQHEGYEEMQSSWSPDAKAKKRELFRGREETWLSISVLLARFGEVDRLQGIEKVPFAQRIAQLTDYLEEAKDKYRLEG